MVNLQINWQSARDLTAKLAPATVSHDDGASRYSQNEEWDVLPQTWGKENLSPRWFDFPFIN